jgi:hypothetical protein
MLDRVVLILGIRSHFLVRSYEADLGLSCTTVTSDIEDLWEGITLIVKAAYLSIWPPIEIFS